MNEPYTSVYNCATELQYRIIVVNHFTAHRSVADEQRSFALGVQSLFFRLFGSIPGPLLFGAIIDSGCVYSQEECGRIANCWVYDNNLLRLRAYIFCTLGILACLVCTVLSWVFYPPYGFKLAPPDGTEDKCTDPPVDGKLSAPNPVFIADTTARCILY